MLLSASSSSSAILGKWGLLFPFESYSLEPTLHPVANPACVYSFPAGCSLFLFYCDSQRLPFRGQLRSTCSEPWSQMPSWLLADTVSVTFHPDGAVCSDAPIDLPGYGAEGQPEEDENKASTAGWYLVNKEM